MNAAEHRLVSGLAMAAAAAVVTPKPPSDQPATTSQDDDSSLAPVIAAGGFGALCGTLPNIVEPALNPRHRQFFHSLAFAAILATGMRQLWQWQPEEEWQVWARRAGLVAGGAYLVHLALDATTPMGLPLVGKV